MELYLKEKKLSTNYHSNKGFLCIKYILLKGIYICIPGGKAGSKYRQTSSALVYIQVVER